MSALQQSIASTLEGCCVSNGPYGAGGYPPFDTATEGLSGRQAAAVPGERLNSVWAVVNHLALFQDHFSRALRGETVEEITGAATVMRELATGVSVSGEHLVDIVGTGGDGISTFNISTASTFVVAAAGGQVAKHGNRSVSSNSGAADLLEAAGVRLDLSAEEVARCVDTVGVGFMFAQNHHSAMKHAIGPRKELAMRTIFNILGPMTNPAGVKRMLIGVFDQNLCRPMAEVLGRLGAEHAMVIHSDDGRVCTGTVR